MLRRFSRQTWEILLTGFAVGLLVGGALSAGIWLGEGRDANREFAAQFAELKLKASASHGADTFAVATGPVDEDVEGLFTLDFLTGDLQCFVINPRTAGVGGRFATNVNDAKIFGAKKGKKPNFLLVTGQLNSSGGYAGGGRLANSICYVVDANSGEVAAFGFPWNKTAVNNGGVQAFPMIPMGKWSARELRQ